MTREHPTKQEVKIKTVFIEYLKSLGKKIEVDESITDRPDMGLYVDGEFIGCEMATITRAEFEKWVRDKFIRTDEFGNIVPT
jgi:hypothetical protein